MYIVTYITSIREMTRGKERKQCAVWQCWRHFEWKSSYFRYVYGICVFFSSIRCCSHSFSFVHRRNVHIEPKIGSQFSNETHHMLEFHHPQQRKMNKTRIQIILWETVLFWEICIWCRQSVQEKKNANIIMVVNVYYCVACWTRKANKKELQQSSQVSSSFFLLDRPQWPLRKYNEQTHTIFSRYLFFFHDSKEIV